MEKLPVSVLINTFNEEINIRNCLETVKWAEEIIIVDMYSEDKTVEIAKEYTNKIFFFERMGYADPARSFALSRATKDWILIVDADELVPKKLYIKLKKIMDKDMADVVWIPRNNYFFGKLLKATGWGALQDMQPRFFKKRYIELSPVIHAIFKINPNARVYKILNPEEGFIHFNYIDVEHFLEKLNRYTTIEAKNSFNGLKPKLTRKRYFYLILKEFINRLIRKKGYKDSDIGFGLTMLMIAYHTSTFLKYKIMEKYNTIDTRDKILEEYIKIANNYIIEYKNET